MAAEKKCPGFVSDLYIGYLTIIACPAAFYASFQSWSQAFPGEAQARLISHCRLLDHIVSLTLRFLHSGIDPFLRLLYTSFYAFSAALESFPVERADALF